MFLLFINNRDSINNYYHKIGYYVNIYTMILPTVFVHNYSIVLYVFMFQCRYIIVFDLCHIISVMSFTYTCSITVHIVCHPMTAKGVEPKLLYYMCVETMLKLRKPITYGYLE